MGRGASEEDHPTGTTIYALAGVRPQQRSVAGPAGPKCNNPGRQAWESAVLPWQAPEGRNTVMSHSYNCVYVHLIFSTHLRRALIPADRRHALWKYLASIARNHGMKAMAVGGMPDHVHLLLSLPGETGVAKAVNLLKSNSSKWMREDYRDFGWQEGYAAFSVSASSIDTVIEYIEGQTSHHRRRDFKAEFLSLLEKHGVKYDAAWVTE